MRMVNYYGPNRPSKRQRYFEQGTNKDREVKTDDLLVWGQHKQELKRQGQDWKGPIIEVSNDLLWKLREWRRNNEEIISTIIFNDTLYNSELANSLADNDIGLNKCYTKMYGSEAPFSQMS